MKPMSDQNLWFRKKIYYKTQHHYIQCILCFQTLGSCRRIAISEEKRAKNKTKNQPCWPKSDIFSFSAKLGLCDFLLVLWCRVTYGLDHDACMHKQWSQSVATITMCTRMRNCEILSFKTGWSFLVVCSSWTWILVVQKRCSERPAGVLWWLCMCAILQTSLVDICVPTFLPTNQPTN